MKKKIISLVVISIFLLTGFASAVEVNTKIETKSNSTLFREDLPDLTVEDIEAGCYHPNPPCPYFWAITVSATVKNQGDIAINKEFWTKFYLDGSTVDDERIGKLEPGQSKKIKVTGYYDQFDRFKKHELTVKADYGNAIEERDESNNVLTVNMRIPKNLNNNLLQKKIKNPILNIFEQLINTFYFLTF